MLTNLKMRISSTYEKQIIQLAALAFIFLWCYTLATKLIDIQSFKWSLFNQPLPHALAIALLFLLPIFELVAAILLLAIRTRLYGFYLSFLLMLLFTGYIGLVIAKVFGTIPCSCGGLLENTSWNEHFYFNLFWLMLSVLAIILIKKGGKKKHNIYN